MSTGTITAITDEVYSELSACAEQEVRNNVHSTVLNSIYFTSREENVSKRGYLFSIRYQLRGQKRCTGHLHTQCRAASEWKASSTISNDVV